MQNGGKQPRLRQSSKQYKEIKYRKVDDRYIIVEGHLFSQK
jgi:hypothetical protein